MILIDVMIPVTEEVADFLVQEDLPVGEVKEEVLRLIKGKNTSYRICGEELSFYAYFKEQILDETLSLKEQGIGDGDKLILI